MKISILDRLVFRTPANAYNNKAVVNADAIREALYLASPVLTEELNKYEKGFIKDGKEKKKLEESIYKYYSRSCTRCTPFGLFAGVGTAVWGDTSNIVLADKKQRETRLDMNYVCAMGQYIASLEDIRAQLLFYPNNSIYTIADKIRYVDYKYVKTRRSHQISEVDKGEYLAAILQGAEKGALIRDLAACISSEDISTTEATGFVLEIIEAQLLKSELEPNVTGENYFDVLLQKLVQLQKNYLHNNAELQHIIHVLTQIEVQLQQLDENFSNPVNAYKQIIETVKQLPVKFEENNLFQTDLYLNTTSDNTINKGLQKDLIKTLGFLTKLSSAPVETNLGKFAEEYYKRYEEAELPLLFVLDTELGIGFANNKGGDHNPLIDGLTFQIENELRKKQNTSLNYDAVSRLLEQKLREAYKNKEYTVHFNDEDLKDLPAVETKQAATFTVGFALPNVNQLLLNFAGGGASAATMLGRFAGGSEEVLDISREIIEHENKFYEEKIVAEIVHLPESRTGNILMRPSFREYEIPYLANASVSPDKVIPLSDILISVPNGRQVVLRSKKLNKEIIPRLTNAHNFWFNALPVYQFLCELQLQETKNSLSFDWGVFSSLYPFKPRAVYGNVILKEASWDLKKEDFKDLIEKGFSKENIQLFLNKWQLPEIVCLKDADNTLLVEWLDELSFNSFISSIKKRETGITLVEHIFNGSVVKDKEGKTYENEFLAFFLNEELPLKKDQKKISPSTTHIQRHFPPGSEWLYYKIYTGIHTTDKILGNCIKPLTEELWAEGLIDKWFFIRYADPEKHLRIRLHIPDPADYGRIVKRISQVTNTLVDEKLIWKLQTDTYSRELERYGIGTIEECENYFWKDSVFICEVLHSIEGEEGEQIRWITGLRAVDELLNDFGFKLHTKKAFMNNLASSFRKENGDGKTLRLLLDTKFREQRKVLELNLNKEKDNENELSLIWNLLSKKQEETRPVIERINAFYREEPAGPAYYNLVSSLIHMLLNRLFKSQQRIHEMVIYDFLFNYYSSLIARSEKSNKQKNATAEINF